MNLMTADIPRKSSSEEALLLERLWREKASCIYVKENSVSV